MSERPVDPELSVEGRRPTVWLKPGNFTNTELTINKSSPSQLMKGRRHAKRPESAYSTALSSSTSNNKITSTGEGGGPDEMDLRKVYDSANYSDEDIKGSKISHDNRNNNGRFNALMDEEPWFLNTSYHMADRGFIPDPPVSCPGTVGMALSTDTDTTEVDSGPYGTIGCLYQEYFPYTFAASRLVKTLTEEQKKNVDNPPGTPYGLFPETPCVLRRKRSKSPRRKRGKSKSPKGKYSYTWCPMPSGVLHQPLEKAYLRTAEAPLIGEAPGTLAVTPFQPDLARLRMERLQLEEKHLLEVKRQDELERIRGPVPRWYELKSPDFHYEAHKNTELIRHENEWQEMLDYRRALLAAHDEDVHHIYRQTV